MLHTTKRGPDTQVKVVTLITKIENDLKEVRALISAG